jgi:hypothetical protein
MELNMAGGTFSIFESFEPSQVKNIQNFEI